jgi:hypothetical protein
MTVGVAGWATLDPGVVSGAVRLAGGHPCFMLSAIKVAIVVNGGRIGLSPTIITSSFTRGPMAGLLRYECPFFVHELAGYPV